MRLTLLLRMLLMLILAGLLVAGWLLHIVSVDLADDYPELAHLRLPIYLAVLAGLLPVIAAIRVVFALLRVVDQGAAFSPRSVELLRRVSMLFGVVAGYLLLGGNTAPDPSLMPTRL